MKKILPSLLLGLFSSSLAYAAQGMAPFPGLQQMALFSAVGLLAACLTVICWLPGLQARTTDTHVSYLFQPDKLETLGSLLRRWPSISNRSVSYILLLITVLLAANLFRLNISDDLRLLQTSPSSLLDQDRQVQTLLNAVNPGQYFIISGDSAQTVLQQEEALSQQLEELIKSGEISSYTATSQWLPSIERQNENYQLLTQQVYNSDGLLDQLAQTSGLNNIQQLAQQQFQQTPLRPLAVADWLQSEASQPTAHLWLGQQGPFYSSLITLSGIQGRAAIDALSSLTDANRGIIFVDQPGKISQLLAHYRAKLGQWLLIAYALVGIALVMRYRAQAWQVIAAPALASLISLNILHLLGTELTFFHSIALLLVLGIGLDASIFMRDSHNNPSTWIAITLSSATTLMAFGLLSLSKTPVLHYFGETVLWGIIAVWLLAPCFSSEKSDALRIDNE